jgi:hypothetical protein
MNVKSTNLRMGFALLVSMLLLSACGGSGGGGGASAPAGPSVTATDPPNTAVGAGLTRVLGVTFSAPVDATTVNAGSFTLTGPAGPVSGAVTILGPAVATFGPTNALAFNSDYTATLTTAIRDTAGNPLAADYVWRFNTGRKFAVGGGHTCARLDNGQIKCWGNNGAGQLGLGDTSTRGDGVNEMGDNLPAVDLGSGRTALAAGTSYTCARLDNGRIKCWGGNAAGQLGLGDVNARGERDELVAPRVPGFREAVAHEDERPGAGLREMHAEAVRLDEPVADVHYYAGSSPITSLKRPRPMQSVTCTVSSMISASEKWRRSSLHSASST